MSVFNQISINQMPFWVKDRISFQPAVDFELLNGNLEQYIPSIAKPIAPLWVGLASSIPRYLLSFGQFNEFIILVDYLSRSRNIRGDIKVNIYGIKNDEGFSMHFTRTIGGVHQTEDIITTIKEEFPNYKKFHEYFENLKKLHSIARNVGEKIQETTDEEVIEYCSIAFQFVKDTFSRLISGREPLVDIDTFYYSTNFSWYLNFKKPYERCKEFYQHEISES